MPRIDLIKKIPISQSGRARQLEAMFDVPRKIQSVVEWHGDLPIEDFDWNVGLIVGPSGSGKSSILENSFGKVKEFHWSAPSVIDDFGGVYKALGYRLRAYPAHPSFIAVRSKSRSWRLVKAAGVFHARNQIGPTGLMGGRPCAIFEYIGPAGDRKIAEQLLC